MDTNVLDELFEDVDIISRAPPPPDPKLMEGLKSYDEVLASMERIAQNGPTYILLPLPDKEGLHLRTLEECSVEEVISWSKFVMPPGPQIVSSPGQQMPPDKELKEALFAGTVASCRQLTIPIDEEVSESIKRNPPEEE